MFRSFCYPFVSEVAKAQFLFRYREIENAVWPRPFEGRFVETAAGRTYVRISGNPGGEPLVLLPGVTTTSLSFAPNAAALGKRYRLYAVDTINDHGLSVNTHFLLLHAQYRDWLSSLLEGLQLESAHFLGWSLGGFTAADFAKSHPDRVRSLILAAPGCVASRLSVPFVLRGIPVWFFPLWGSHHAFPWLFADAARHPRTGPVPFQKFMEFSDLCFRSFHRRLPHVPYVFSAADWCRLTMPCLFLAGTHEKLYNPQKAAARLHRLAPQVEIKLIEGAGHDVLWEKAEEVNRAVLEFLGKR